MRSTKLGTVGFGHSTSEFIQILNDQGRPRKNIRSLLYFHALLYTSRNSKIIIELVNID